MKTARGATGKWLLAWLGIAAMWLPAAGALAADEPKAEAAPAKAEEKPKADVVLKGDAVCTRCHDESEAYPVLSIGKVKDLFAGRGIARAIPTASDSEGMDRVVEAMREEQQGLIFANLVDFDAVYGHRNDTAGYAANLEQFDVRLGSLLDLMRPDDLLVITADHGNDPTTPSTDHSREYVPLLLAGAGVTKGVDLGTRSTFADLGQTIAELFGVGPLQHGTSFLGDILMNGRKG